MAQAREHLPSMCEALGKIPSYAHFYVYYQIVYQKGYI
jgi:hypothetical protein